jgi:hypothetical protein
VQHSVFALEVCVRLDRAPELGRALRDRISGAPEGMGFQEKWQFYRDCAWDLSSSIDSVERGIWDFFDDDTRARKAFDDYSSTLTTHQGARTEPSSAGPDDPYRGGDPRYLTFTMALLLSQGTQTERALAALCNIPESELWTRATFARILSGLGALSFASVKGDVAYLIPRDEGWGLTFQDLQDPKFEYLRTIT